MMCPDSRVSPPLPGRRPPGSAMLVVLWAIVVMSFAVVGFLEFARYDIDRGVTGAKEFRARHLAESGLVLARHPAVAPHDPLLHRDVSELQRLDVEITTEGTRINLNTLGNPRVHKLTRDLLFRWGLDMERAETLCDSLADWVDGDDTERVRGAEEKYYAALGFEHYPRNGAFISVDEALFVRGMDELAALRPDWREYFTLWGDGRIDVNEAGQELLEIALDENPEAIRRLLDRRRGPDLIENTEDDEPFTDLDTLRRVMIVESTTWGHFAELITLQHPVRRIESRARVDNHTKTLVLIEGDGHRLQWFK